MLSYKGYKNKKQKIVDFAIGFFAIFAAVNLLAFIISLFNILITLILDSSQTTIEIYYKVMFVIHWILILALYGWSFVFFYGKRKYIAFGVLAEFISIILLGTFLVYGLN